jgi:hypothetical protein
MIALDRVSSRKVGGESGVVYLGRVSDLGYHTAAPAKSSTCFNLLPIPQGNFASSVNIPIMKFCKRLWTAEVLHS